MSDHRAPAGGGPAGADAAHGEELDGDPSTIVSRVCFDGYPVAVGPGCVTTLGWPADALLAVSWWELLHPDDQHTMVEAVERAMTGGVGAERDVRMVRRDGTWLWVRYGIADVDRQRELYLQTGVVLGEADDPPVLADMWSWHRESDLLALREEFVTMLGERPPLTFERWLTHVHPADRVRVRTVAETVAAVGEAYSEDYRVVSPDGDVFRWHVAGRPYPGDDGRFTVVRGFVRDITGPSPATTRSSRT